MLAGQHRNAVMNRMSEYQASLPTLQKPIGSKLGGSEPTTALSAAINPKALKPRTYTSIGAELLGFNPLKTRKTQNLTSSNDELKKLAINQTSIEELRKEFLSLIRGQYKPDSIFPNIVGNMSKNNDKFFESVVMYQIQGSKFEQILDPSQVGVFDASRSYFIIFTQPAEKGVSESSALAKTKHAIYLWIGSKQIKHKK